LTDEPFRNLSMLTLILGGARSGKSSYAQALCRNEREVIFVATARVEDGDEEMSARISRHRAERPPEWETIEEPLDLARVIREASRPNSLLLVDCITLWVSNLMWEYRALSDDERERLVIERATEFAQAAREHQVIAVSNEVGSSVVPEHEVGRAFRDLQGLVNQSLAREARRVVLMVAGLPLTLKDEQHPK
jgi:adenosylcobinamide kinase/adenosylcobinamide-phosphate guanylyltransferase